MKMATPFQSSQPVPTAAGSGFTSKIRPPCLRRTLSTEELIPWLDL